MKNELTCGVVRDLLPNYIEELTGEETNEAVRSHLASCSECREIYSSMTQDEAILKPVETKEIDYLKKTRERGRKKIILAMFFVAGFFLLGVFVNRFFIGKEVKNSNLIQAQARVENGRVIVSGNLKDTGKGATALSFSEENGVVTVSLKQMAKSVFHDNVFYGCYDAKEPVVQVKLGKRILWDGGEMISEDVAKAFESKNLYIGDMSANGRVAGALKIYENLGGFLNELQTGEKPYGWKLIGQQDYAGRTEEWVEERMFSYGCALISLIDNLGYVTFEYSVDGVEKSLTITEEEADLKVGESVKGMAGTACGLQKLLKILNLTTGFLGNQLHEYRQNDEGLWECNGNTYQYRMVLTGRDPNAVRDGRFVVLTNNPEITYDRVSKSLYGSQIEDSLDSKETVIVEMGGN